MLLHVTTFPFSENVTQSNFSLIIVQYKFHIIIICAQSILKGGLENVLYYFY